jgi:hypothetical protein
MVGDSEVYGGQETLNVKGRDKPEERYLAAYVGKRAWG